MESVIIATECTGGGTNFNVLVPDVVILGIWREDAYPYRQLAERFITSLSRLSGR